MKKFYTLFIILSTCNCWFNVAFAQEVVIVRVPDMALSTALRKALGLAPTALITKQAMSRLTTLNAAGDQQGELPIRDLTGLEHAAQLEILILYWNQQISDLSSITSLKRLRELHLGANQISDISPIAGLKQLERLTLYGNQISDISPIAGLKRLRELHLSANQISDISPIAGLEQLRELHLDENQISDISPIAGLKQLRWLYLTDNQISDISPIAGLTQLETLYIPNNQIRGVNPLAGLVNLKKLVIAGNPVRDASPLANLTKLVEVDIEIPHQVRAGGVISDRHLASAVRTALHLTNIQPITKERMQGLRRLLITENYKVSSLAGLEYATYLEELVFNRTQIGGDLSPLENLTQLKRLDLGYSQISDISPLANLTNLTYLNLQSNQISDISPIANLTQLEFLWLVYNRISDISPLANLRRLTRLGLYTNRIRDVSPLAGLVNLEVLSLGNNPIGDVSPLAVLPKLRDVDIEIPPPPVVGLGILDRPPIYWIDGGSIYALVGADVQKFAPSVDNALNIAISDGKVYWTEKTGDSAGTINSANIDGSSMTELKSILAVPMGIALDTAASKLYWTNSRGRIQSLNADGSGRIENVLQNLEGAMDIALAGGNVYWTQGGNVRFVNLRGTKQIRNISTGTDTAGSLAIGGGKVYWTEMTGGSGGTINSANLDGTGAKQLASILAVPMGIAVDSARSKLYWSNSRGRIQSANLDGSGIRNVVDGLGSPRDMVLSNSIKAPKTGTLTTTAGKSKYDINGDGIVNSKDVDVLIFALTDGGAETDAEFDVNGDGTVDVLDIKAVNANLNAGAAGVPTLFGTQLSAVQREHFQEQIDLLIATSDRSPAVLKTLIYLQQLLATETRPEKTQLLANYPNPFNPETWIPYRLAESVDVSISIYSVDGQLVRTLDLGHQSVGIYESRSRAAYWDGRNALGEPVASGVYFYTLKAGNFTATRKMLIRK